MRGRLVELLDEFAPQGVEQAFGDHRPPFDRGIQRAARKSSRRADRADRGVKPRSRADARPVRGSLRHATRLQPGLGTPFEAKRLADGSLNGEIEATLRRSGPSNDLRRRRVSSGSSVFQTRSTGSHLPGIEIAADRTGLPPGPAESPAGSGAGRCPRLQVTGELHKLGPLFGNLIPLFGIKD